MNLQRVREDPTWLPEVTAWVEQELAATNRRLAGPPVEVRVMPWAAVFRFPTDGGDVYFKAGAPSQAFEPALLRFLAARRPGDVLPVLAADLRRAWLLLPDGGPVLRHITREDPADVVAHWRAILPRAAALQRGLSGDAAHLLALGVPDRRAMTLPLLYEELLTGDNLPLDVPGGPTGGDLAHLRALAPRFAALCAELNASGMADTLVQDDFHDGHVFVNDDAGGHRRYTFFDFGDACVGHPFLQMVSPLRFFPRRYGTLELDDKDVESLYKIYTGQWPGVTAKRRRVLAVALAVGAVMRILNWTHAVGPYQAELSADMRSEFGRGYKFWLLEFVRRSAGLADG